MMGVEPTSPAWKAEVIAVIQHPQIRSQIKRADQHIIN